MGRIVGIWEVLRGRLRHLHPRFHPTACFIFPGHLPVNLDDRKMSHEDPGRKIDGHIGTLRVPGTRLALDVTESCECPHRLSYSRLGNRFTMGIVTVTTLYGFHTVSSGQEKC